MQNTPKRRISSSPRGLLPSAERETTCPGPSSSTKFCASGTVLMAEPPVGPPASAVADAAETEPTS